MDLRLENSPYGPYELAAESFDIGLADSTWSGREEKC